MQVYMQLKNKTKNEVNSWNCIMGTENMLCC